MRRTAPPLLLAVLAAVLALPSTAFAATDPYRSSQWGLQKAGVEAAWAAVRGQGQVIAVIDSGVDLTHPDLVDRLARDAAGRLVGKDYIDGDRRPDDRNGHGTMVAGIALATAENGIGIAGVAPRARLMPIRVLDEMGRGRASDVDAAVRWAVDHGATVVNLSLESVAPLPGSLLPQAPTEAVRYAWERGVAVIAAAGNSGAPFTDYPDSSPVLLVGATDRDDRRAAFSDRGRRDAVLAPGVGIVSTWCDPTPEGCDPEQRYGEADGTSFAAPTVAGAIALLQETGLSHQEALERLRSTAVDLGTPGPDREHGHGRVDVAAAVTGLTAGPRSPAPTPSPARSRSVPAPEPSAPAGTAPTPSPTATTTTDAGTAVTATPSGASGPRTAPGTDSSQAPPPPAAEPVSPLDTDTLAAPAPQRGPSGTRPQQRGRWRLAASLLVASSAGLAGAVWRREHVGG